MVRFCTCTDTSCKFHPSRHDKGCTPCISKNLKTQEILSCFFDLIEGAGSRDEGSFKTFAQTVLKQK
ncbi:MAG: DUF6485 family protein [Christensenellales bacterium]